MRSQNLDILRLELVFRLEKNCQCIPGSNGRVIRASASGVVDSGLIPSRVKPMTLKLLFAASLLDAQH